MNLPHPSATRLQNLVATFRKSNFAIDRTRAESLERFNPWTTADDILAEDKIQRNGSNKLPEEAAATAPPTVQYDEGEGK